MQLTDEQTHAVDMALAGESMALEALAGTGKTTTLKAISEAKPEDVGLYVAFNKAIQKEAERKFPSNVDARTLHSLAHEAVRQENGWFLDRMGNAERLKSGAIANLLDIEALVVPHWSGSGQGVRLSKGRLAGYAMRMIRNFCTTGDSVPSSRHMPRIDGLEKDGEWTIHNMIGDWLEGHVLRAWEDLTSPSGRLPFEHAHYLKMFQLMKPKFPVDFLLIDEAQDLNPLMSAILTGQTESQIIAVGDARQQIYEWNGAVNALDSFGENRSWLTKSFRFGPEIAGVANFILKEMLGETVQVEGLGQSGSVCSLDNPDAFLARRNSTAIRRAAFEMAQGKKVHVEGGGKEISAFAYAALDVMAGRWCSHPELACFESWDEVCEYVQDDELGGDLTTMVALVNEIGAPTIIDTVKNLSGKRAAQMVISTAHKSKGLEWDNVTLARDMVRRSTVENVEYYDPGKMTTEDQRLLYVAATRAESSLDVSALEPLAHLHN